VEEAELHFFIQTSIIIIIIIIIIAIIRPVLITAILLSSHFLDETAGCFRDHKV